MGARLHSLVQLVKNLDMESLEYEDDDDFDDGCCEEDAVVDDSFTYPCDGDHEESEYENEDDKGAAVTKLNAASLPRASSVRRRLDFSGEIIDDHQEHRPCLIDAVHGCASQITSRNAGSTMQLEFDTGTMVLCGCKGSHNKCHPGADHHIGANTKPEITAQSSMSNSYTRSSQKHLSVHKMNPRPAKLAAKGFNNKPVGHKDKVPISVRERADAEKSNNGTCEHIVKPTSVYKSKRTSGYNYGLPLSSLPAPNKKQAGEQRIRVCVRKRPLTHAESRRGNADVVTTQGEECVIVHKSKEAVDLTQYILQHRFYFDQVFGDETSNEEVYRRTAYPLVQHMLNGGKATCFAYGQTGAGKTHTMLGPSPRRPGLYVLAARDIFAQLSTVHTPPSRLVYVSFFEIYCGQLYDLLDHRKRLFAREDGYQVVHIAGLRHVRVDSVNSLLEVISQGTEVRTQGVSGVNPFSSRSHALLQIQLRGPKQQIAGRMWFVDLAGSERASDTKEPSRHSRMEGAEINQSLLALKECIRSLDQEQAHTPFRQSKLTQVLKDSFVGDSKTCMIANISPGHSATEHTLNTLRYADRVKELRGQAGARGGRMGKRTPTPKRNQTSRSSCSDSINIRGKSPPKKPKLKSQKEALAHTTSTRRAPTGRRNFCSTPTNCRWGGDKNAEERVVAGLQHITPVRGLLGTCDKKQKKEGAGEMEVWKTEVVRGYGGTEGADHPNKHDQNARAKLVLGRTPDNQGRVCEVNQSSAQRETGFSDREREKEQNTFKREREERTWSRQVESNGETYVREMDLEDIEERNAERKRHLKWYHQQLQRCVSSPASSSVHLFSSPSITSSFSPSNCSPLSSDACSSLQHSSHRSPITYQGLEEVLDVYRAGVEVRADGNRGQLFFSSEEIPLQTENNDEGDHGDAGGVGEARMAHLEGAGRTVKDRGKREKMWPLDIAGERKLRGKREEQNPTGMERGQRRLAWGATAETEEADRMASMMPCHTDILVSSNCDSEVRRRAVEEGREGGDASDVPVEGHWRIKEEGAYSYSLVSTCRNNNSNSLFDHVHVEPPYVDKPNQRAPAERPLSPAFERINNLLTPNKLCESKDTCLTSHILPLGLQDVIPGNSPHEVPSCSTREKEAWSAAKASSRGFSLLPSLPLTASLIQNDCKIPAKSQNKISENPALVSTGLITILPHTQVHNQPEVKAKMPILSPGETSEESPNYPMDPLSISLLQVDQQAASTSFLQGGQSITFLCPPDNKWREDDRNGRSAEMAVQGVKDEEGEFWILNLPYEIQSQSMVASNHKEQRADMSHVTHHVNGTGTIKPPIPVVTHDSLKDKSSQKPQAQPGIVTLDDKAPTSPLKPSPHPSTQTSLISSVSSSIQQFKDSSQLSSYNLFPPPMQMPAEYLTDTQSTPASFMSTLQSGSNLGHLNTGWPHSAGSTHCNNSNGSLQLNCTSEINREERIFNEQKRPIIHPSTPEKLDHGQWRVVQAHCEQREQMEALCRKERTLLCQQPEMTFGEYVHRLEEIMERKALCVHSMRSQLQPYLKPSHSNHQHNNGKDNHDPNT